MAQYKASTPASQRKRLEEEDAQAWSTSTQYHSKEIVWDAKNVNHKQISLQKCTSVDLGTTAPLRTSVGFPTI